MNRATTSICLIVAALGLSLDGCVATKEQSSSAQSRWNLPGQPPHLVAHYMPWFQVQRSASDSTVTWSHWKWTSGGPAHDPEKRRPDGLRDICSVHYPLIGPYNSWSRDVVRYHLKTAKAAGVQAFLLIWYGANSYEDQQVPAILDEAGKLGMRIAICYEEKINFPDYRDPSSREEIVANTTRDLAYILDRYSPHPAYLKRDGKPFIYQFNGWGTGSLGPKYLTPAEWKEVFAALTSPVVYGRQNLDEAYHPPIESAYVWWTTDTEWLARFPRRAAELRKQDRLAFFMTMICPGFDDTGVWGWGNGPRKVERHGLSVLKDTFDRSFAHDPELIQIVTWNDFAEGTAVEPTRENGFWYLDAIETWWGERTGRRVNLDDNRKPFLEYARRAKDKSELPAPPYDDFLQQRPIIVEKQHVLPALKAGK